MRRTSCTALAAVVLLLSAVEAAAGKQPGRERLDAYTAVVQPGDLKSLADQGFEYHGKRVPGGVEVDLVMTRSQRDKLAQEGIDASLTRVQGGLTVQQFAARQAVAASAEATETGPVGAGPVGAGPAMPVMPFPTFENVPTLPQQSPGNGYESGRDSRAR